MRANPELIPLNPLLSEPCFDLFYAETEEKIGRDDLLPGCDLFLVFLE
jgi:hypothetical protein